MPEDTASGANSMSTQIIQSPDGRHLRSLAFTRGTGESPGKEPKIELIPYTMHSKNARAVLSHEAWTQVRKIAHERNGRMCCECGDWRGTLECHEAWGYEWRPRGEDPVMKMTGLVSLCHLCHMGKHIGFAKRNGELEQVTAHLTKLHGISETHLDSIVRRAVSRVERLSMHTFQLDLTYMISVASDLQSDSGWRACHAANARSYRSSAASYRSNTQGVQPLRQQSSSAGGLGGCGRGSEGSRREPLASTDTG